MFAKQLITDEIPSLKTSDTGSEALNMMEDFKISHLPIVNNEEFLGLISEADILTMNNFDAPLGNHNLSLSTPYVTENQHFFEIVKLISDLNLSIVPVLDNKNHYLGSISLKVLVQNLAKIAAVEQPGGVIILDINANNYSLSEIAQIAESNNAKILSLCVTSYPDSTELEVAIKINKIEIQPILQTFQRYNYEVKAFFSEKSDMDDLKERYDSLMNYLNI